MINRLVVEILTLRLDTSNPAFGPASIAKRLTEIIQKDAFAQVDITTTGRGVVYTVKYITKKEQEQGD